MLSSACVTETRGTPDPDQPRSMRGGGPPPEAFAACQSQSVDQLCTATTPRGPLSGTCVSDRQSTELVCAPDRNADGGRPDRRPDGRGPGGGGDQRPMRDHRAVQSAIAPALYPATVTPITQSIITLSADGQWRSIRSNSISEHLTGEFPNSGNPNTIAEFAINMRIPANPVHSGRATRVKVPGVAMNGVSFDPGAGEFYRGDPSLGWQYEALSGAVALGLDDNHAHVQPTGKYHYHGLPTGLMDRLSVNAAQHSKQIGWAVDGFPIYARYGYASADGTKVADMTSSYHLKSGSRPSGGDQPGGTYDGTFTADYDYVPGSGDLDECNGKLTVTPDFPNGTYAYFLTTDYPVVPRCVMGTPDPEARQDSPPPGQGRGRQR